MKALRKYPLQADPEVLKALQAIADALFFHQHLIERYGGASGIRDLGALESALRRPQTGYCETLNQEAVSLCESLI